MASFLSVALGILFVAQTMHATIAGTVRDGETGRPLADALLTLSDLDRSVTTDSLGHYMLQDVPAGPQHLTIRFLGYGSRTLHALVPSNGELEINISLQPQPIPLEPLEVRSRLGMMGIEADDSTVFPDRGLSISAVANHPLLAEPDVLEALAGGAVVLSPESPSGVHIRGGASDQTAYLLDGVPVFSPYHAAGLFSAWNPDALSSLSISSAAPSPALPDALSGVVSATTRTPGDHLRLQGSASTSQARITADGPLGSAGAGYLLSLRSGFPDILPPADDASYLRGQTGDWLAKVEAPVFGGRFRMLGYGSDNEINTASEADASDATRNVFEWRSRSVGLEWSRALTPTTLRVQAWSARADAGALWASRTEMSGARRDEGLLATLDRRAVETAFGTGIRIERRRTSYRVVSNDEDPAWQADARTPVVTAFLHGSTPITRRLTIEVGAAAASAADDIHLSPRVQLRWMPTTAFTLSASHARLHQFAQSLRNTESVVGRVFPADLFVGSGKAGVPVARSDQNILALDYRANAGMRFRLQAYTRRFENLVLVAPGSSDPFANGEFQTGSGTARGLSADVSMSGARYGIIASYGWQRVRYAAADSKYVPEHGTAHLVNAGMIVFPTVTSSVRLGATGAFGRRGTPVIGGLEWESCNLLDHGCEFGGSPEVDPESLGTTLPHYLRVDMGVRKHWHVGVAGRDATIALFGTITNILARANLLTRATDPATGERTPIEMRPLSPLVVGLDWRF